MWYSENIGRFDLARPFKYEGIAYPATTFKNPELLESLTIYPLRKEDVDSRYYNEGDMSLTFDSEDKVWVESYEAIPKEFEALQKDLAKDYLSRLNTTLSRTDFLLTRSDEMAQWFSKWTINPAIQQWRDGVYLLFNARMNSITEAVTFEGLKLADEQPFNIPDQPEIYEYEEEQ